MIDILCYYLIVETEMNFNVCEDFVNSSGIFSKYYTYGTCSYKTDDRPEATKAEKLIQYIVLFTPRNSFFPCLEMYD